MRKLFSSLLLVFVLIVSAAAVSASSSNHTLNVEVKSFEKFNTYDDYKRYRYSVFDVEDVHATSMQEVSDVEKHYYEDLDKAKAYFDAKRKK